MGSNPTLDNLIFINTVHENKLSLNTVHEKSIPWAILQQVSKNEFSLFLIKTKADQGLLS